MAGGSTTAAPRNQPGADFEGFNTLSFPSHLVRHPVPRAPGAPARPADLARLSPPQDDPAIGDGIKDSVFRRGFNKVAEYLRIKEIRSIPATGEDLLTIGEIDRFQ